MGTLSVVSINFTRELRNEKGGQAINIVNTYRNLKYVYSFASSSSTVQVVHTTHTCTAPHGVRAPVFLALVVVAINDTTWAMY